MKTARILRSGQDSVSLDEASVDEILSARAHAWSEYFYNKEDRAFGENWSDYSFTINSLKVECGIVAIEGELLKRGICPKEKNYSRSGCRWSRS